MLAEGRGNTVQHIGDCFHLVARRGRVRQVISAAVGLDRLNLSVEKAGIYAVELTPQTGFTVSEVRGEGVDESSLKGGLPFEV
jgi:hypothetical protein